MTTLTLRPGEEWRLLMGQRAVYAGEVAQIEGELMAGGVADVRSAQGRFLGRGLLSPASKILLRIRNRPGRIASCWERSTAAAWSLETPTVCRG